MYVAKICRRGPLIDARVFEKVWSEELASNKVEKINNKKFILKNNALSWAYKEICNNMIDQNRLEIVNE